MLLAQTYKSSILTVKLFNFSKFKLICLKSFITADKIIVNGLLVNLKNCAGT